MLIVNSFIQRTAIAASASALIDSIRSRNREINTEAVLGGSVTQQAMAGAAAQDLPINGAHGNRELYVSALGQTTPTQVPIAQITSIRLRSKAGYFWMAYARELAPKHAGLDVCTMVEFFCSGTTAKTRLVYEYVRGIFMFTTDHYVSYFIVADGDALVRDFVPSA